MKKIFLAICFSIILGIPNMVYAEVIPLQGIEQIKKTRKHANPKPDLSLAAKQLPDPNDEEAVRAFFKKRLEDAPQTKIKNVEDWYESSSASVIPPLEHTIKEAEEKKSTFQKIYEDALASIRNNENKSDGSMSDKEKEIAKSATRFFTLQKDDKAKNNELPKIPTVSVSLPSGRKILAPAEEHIPYYLSFIDIQSNGYIKVEDTITIVANGKKFAYGLERVFSKYTYFKNKRQHRIELLLNDVSVNGVKIPYTAEEFGNNIIIKPKYNQKLEPGVYTYKFNYIINNKLIVDGDNAILSWNLTGQPMDAFITSANAIVTVPQGHSFNNQTVFLGKNKKYTNNRTNVFPLAKNVLAYSNVTPMFNGEEMNVVAVFNSNTLLNDYNKTYTTFIIDWGNILYATLGLLTISISLFLSIISLKKDSKNNKYNPSYNGSLMRNILIGKYDRIAFISQLLELYRKDAIDLVSEDNHNYIERKNIKSKKLNKTEKKALKILFAKKATKVEINTSNNIRFKKAKKIFEKHTHKQIKKYRLIHNIGYIILSIAILLLTEAFISYISINFAQSFMIMLFSSLLYGFYIWIIRHRFKYIIVSLPIKIFSLVALALIWIFCSIYIGGITAAIILATVTIIFIFTQIFNEHNNFINDAKSTIDNFKEYLISSSDAINLSRDFSNHQSNIFALDICEYYPQNVSNKNNYKLDTANNIKQALIGII